VKKSLLNECLKISKKKLHNHPELCSGFCHYAFIIQNNQIIDYSINRKHEPKISWGYHAIEVKGETFVPKLHAEIWAYKKAVGLLNKFQPFYIINIRLSKAGFCRLSKPCPICYKLLSFLGCAKFWYSVGIDNEFATIRGNTKL